MIYSTDGPSAYTCNTHKGIVGARTISKTYDNTNKDVRYVRYLCVYLGQLVWAFSVFAKLEMQVRSVGSSRPEFTPYSCLRINMLISPFSSNDHYSKKQQSSEARGDSYARCVSHGVCQNHSTLEEPKRLIESME